MTGRRHITIALAALLAAATAACSGADADPPDPPPTATSAAPPSTSPPPTPEELAAQEALAVFEASFEVTDRVLQAPSSRDWEPEIRRYSIDPAAAAEVQGLTDLRELGIRQQGTSSIEPQVTGIDLQAEAVPTVSIKACFDNSTSELVYAQTGVPIRPPDAPEELQRYWWQVTVVQMPGQSWRVSVVEPQTESAC